MRPIGLSAFVRCKNEEEYIVASLMSVVRVFDEIIVVLNNCTDRTAELVADLISFQPKIRLMTYADECTPIGPRYLEAVSAKPGTSIARYYNWCLEQTSYSHVCKWDGDMIATPVFEQVRDLFPSSEVVVFDGYDVLGKQTTDMEPRIFKYNPARARYVDWDLYEVLEHDYSKLSRMDQKCYLHMKLVKKDWLHKTWSSPNLLATRSVPEMGKPRMSVTTWARRIARSSWRRKSSGG
jgi:glycosyltransferase involved in cell wall biosynthesis